MSGWGIGRRRNQRELEKVQGFDPMKVRNLVEGLMGQLRGAGVEPLEIFGVADGIFMTMATTLLEVAQPGEPREKVRKDITDILDRMRRAVETAPHGSDEVN